jgi:hypothetical protein
MRYVKYTTLIVSLLTPLMVMAQAIQPGVLTNVQSRDILMKYASSQTNTNAGRDSIIRLVGNLQKEKSNIQTLRMLLSKKLSTEEKALVLRLLGEMRDANNAHGLNPVIIRELQLQMQTTDREIATAALFAYTRSGYDKDYLTSIRQLRDRKIIGDDTYFGEHAHLFSFAPEPEQQVMLAEIAKSKNRYALQILTSGLPPRPLSPATRNLLLATLEANEPALPMAIGELQGSDDWASWLSTVAMLRFGDAQARQRNFILQRLVQPELDPRKILAYLSGPYGRAFIRETGDVRLLGTLTGKVCQYTNSFPTTPAIQEAGGTVQFILRESHPELSVTSCAR